MHANFSAHSAYANKLHIEKVLAQRTITIRDGIVRKSLKSLIKVRLFGALFAARGALGRCRAGLFQGEHGNRRKTRKRFAQGHSSD
ncbi:MAG: hypothetical protein NOF05_13635 [Candidatus Accumulibacter phosphatis]|nr:hypothetical protein [Candidatus Accumulibacter phosphatis]